MRRVLGTWMFILLLAAMVLPACSGQQAKSGEIVFGALQPLTGGLSSRGEASRAVLEMATADINGYLTSVGSQTTVKMIVEDTASDPATALEKLKSLAAKGVKIVIGPESSAEVRAVKAFAEEKGILLLSNSSTALSLAVPGDNVFRFVPDDRHPIEALARLMWEDGVRVAVPIWRGDEWGDSSAELLRNKFKEMGGAVEDGVKYDPATRDFSTVLESLSAQVSQTVSQYGSVAPVAVDLMAFDEAVAIFKQAEKHPVLSTVGWYGSEGTALANALVNDQAAAAFAMKTSFANPMFGENHGDLGQRVKTKIGREPEIDAAAAYDAMWVATKALLAAGGAAKPEALKKALVREAEQYTGATGRTVLNEAGDRKFGSYDLWAIGKAGSSFKWQRTARYEVTGNSPGRLVYEKAPSSPSLKILMVHSYHESWGWNQDTLRGIIEGLSRRGFREGEDYELKTFYMDTKVTYTTLEQIKQRGQAAMELIDSYQPKLVFVNDDDALKQVAVEYTLRHPDKRLPFIFSGINGDPSVFEPIKSLDRPAGLITGALERFPYVDAFSLARRLYPKAARIVLLADTSSSSNFVVNNFKAEYLDKVKDPPLQIAGPIQLKTFKEWKDTVAEYQAKVDVLGILTYHQLKDESGRVVPATEVVDWTVRNSRLPEVGILTFHAEDGFLAAAGVSAYRSGVYVGIVGGEVLRGKDPGSIPIRDPQMVDVGFNLKRAEMLGIEIPAAELSRAAQTYCTIGRSRY